MVGLEGVGAGGLILRDDFKDTYAGTLKERRSTDSNLRRTSRKGSIYDTYVISSSRFTDSERAPTHPSKYIHINFSG